MTIRGERDAHARVSDCERCGYVQGFNLVGGFLLLHAWPDELLAVERQISRDMFTLLTHILT